MIQSKSFFKALPLVPLVVKVLGILQMQPSCSLDHTLVLHGGTELNLTTQLRELVIVQLDDVESIQHMGGTGQMLFDG